MSNPSEDDWKRMTKLVDSFYNKGEAEPFRVPVDWKGFGTFLFALLAVDLWAMGIEVTAGASMTTGLPDATYFAIEASQEVKDLSWPSS